MSLLERHLKVPKYLQLAERLRGEIASGVLKPGDRLPSFHHMRLQCGVTTNTVEKVYGLLEKEGLIVREPSRGTFVAEAKPAESFGAEAGGAEGVSVRRVTDTIGVCGFAFSAYSPYWAQLLEGMHRSADQAGKQLMLLEPFSMAGWEKIDGIIIADFSKTDIAPTVPPGMPCVSLLVPIENMASITADDYSVGYMAAEHLINLGHRRIAYLHGADHSVVPQRLAGYRDALLAAGITPVDAWRRKLVGHYEYGHQLIAIAHETMRQWLAQDWRELGCTALLTHNDEAGIGVMNALDEAGLKIPDDISVIGCDGTEVGLYCRPGLTTIGLPLRQIGNEAMLCLLRQIERDRVSMQHRVLPVKIRERASTAPAVATPGS